MRIEPWNDDDKTAGAVGGAPRTVGNRQTANTLERRFFLDGSLLIELI